MSNRDNQMPEFDREDHGAVFNPADLDEILEKLRSGNIGINQTEGNTPEADLTEDADTGNNTGAGESAGSDEKADSDEESGTRKKKSRKGKKKKGDEDDEPFNLKNEIISWLQVLITAAVIAFCINTFIIANSQVPTGSMETTIMPGDRVIGSRLSYRFGEPERGDIAIFLYPDDEARGIKTYYVKRIIGMPGDTIDIVDGKLYLNGSETPLDEPYIREEMMLEPPMHYEVPEDCYFMMGDNRNYSNDSRRWTNTYVHRDKLIAKVLFQYFPKFKKLQ